MINTVIKRSGEVVDYCRDKIINAIKGASDANSEHMTLEQIISVTDEVEKRISLLSQPTVEGIQDVVEMELMAQGFYDIAKRYIRYRFRHEDRRKASKDLINTYKDMIFVDAADDDRKRENANINTDGTMGIMLKLGTESSKFYIDNYILPEEFVEMDRENWVHIHDKDFSLITFNCCQIDLLKVLHGGFSTGHGFIREPNSVRAYASLACIVIQSNQNDMFEHNRTSVW